MGAHLYDSNITSEDCTEQEASIIALEQGADIVLAEMLDPSKHYLREVPAGISFVTNNSIVPRSHF